MSGFTGFSEAGRLYAQYFGVVTAMREAFERDVDSFLDELRNQIDRLVAPIRLQERQTQGYRYWWLAEDSSDKDAHPQLWLSTRRAEIIVPGELSPIAVAPRGQGEDLRRLAAVASSSGLADFCKAGAGGNWSLFIVSVTYPPDDPVSHAARPIADTLLALRNAAAASAPSTGKPSA